jgi:signal recognition particle receptor subunit beta/rubrerythrin
MLAGNKSDGAKLAGVDQRGPGSGRDNAIGLPLEHARRGLLAVGREMIDVLEPAGVGLADEAQRLLQQLRCKIAVVGQIKAGKSMFINALIGQTGLLPSDINPATSAITSLHFNQPPPGSEVAVFRFFTTNEWEQLASGASRLRDLTQRLVPGFEPALLKRNIGAMIARAEQRLGPQYQTLLGQSHGFAVIERNILRQYICAGDATAQGDIGLYSDITHAADLYIPSGPFAFPVTLIDTPGTNDPFLIRDEVTRNTLDTADAHIVVLSAHQPLSEGDVSLLRILRGLHKERIVVFVNRIDELADVARDTAEVLEFVRKRLGEEFPGCEIPIVAGSAKWGCERAANHGATLAGLACSEHPNSGIAEISTVLNDLLLTTHGAYVLRQIASCYTEMARASQTSLRHQLENSRQRYERTHVVAEKARQDLARLQKEQDVLVQTQQIIERAARDYEAQLLKMMQDDVAELRSRLIGIVDNHAAEQREALIANLQSGRARKVWTCDVDELRRAMGEEFFAGFRRTENRLVDLSVKVVAGLRQLLETLVVANGSAVGGPDMAVGTVASPSPASLGRPLALDLDDSWWSQLWRGKQTPHQRGEALEQLILEEFYPLVDSLVESQSRVFEAYIATNTRWSFAVCGNIVQALARRCKQVSMDFESVRTDVEGTADANAVNDQAATVTDLERRLKIAENTLVRLSVVSRNIQL